MLKYICHDGTCTSEYTIRNKLTHFKELHKALGPPFRAATFNVKSSTDVKKKMMRWFYPAP